MPKSKFVELVFADNDKAPKHSLTGYLTVSDYRAEGMRHVFMRLPDADVAAPTVAKPKRKNKPRQKTAQPTNAASPATSFPGAEV
jgi:hypothetical protein